MKNRVKLAAVQAAPVYMDKMASAEKAATLIRAAGEEGADIIAFPEAFIPGYPYWTRYLPPKESARYSIAYLQQAISVAGEEVALLCAAAAQAQAYVVMGICEKNDKAAGTVYDTNLIIGPDGQVHGHHRKLVPTYSEKLIWSPGDAYGLRALATPKGNIGSLMCGENSNPLARYVLIADGEQVHVSNYFGLPDKDSSAVKFPGDMHIRAAAHSFEGKVFNIITKSVLDDTVRAYFREQPVLSDMLSGGSVCRACIYGPDGYMIAEVDDPDAETILYAEVDLDSIYPQKLRHDVAGAYNRTELIHVTVDRTRVVAYEDDHAQTPRAD